MIKKKVLKKFLIDIKFIDDKVNFTKTQTCVYAESWLDYYDFLSDNLNSEMNFIINNYIKQIYNYLGEKYHLKIETGCITEQDYGFYFKIDI